MPRLRNSAGSVVNVSDATAARLGAGRAPLDGAAGGYADMTVTDIKDEIRARNETRDEDDRLPLTGSKADLIAALTADD